jgi:hypothetical protein
MVGESHGGPRQSTAGCGMRYLRAHLRDVRAAFLLPLRGYDAA